jgi:hypothetical protein
VPERQPGLRPDDPLPRTDVRVAAAKPGRAGRGFVRSVWGEISHRPPIVAPDTGATPPETATVTNADVECMLPRPFARALSAADAEEAAMAIRTADVAGRVLALAQRSGRPASAD